MSHIFLLALVAMISGDRIDYAGAVGETVAISECRKKSSDDEIIVCGERERNRYAITDPKAPFDPDGDMPSVMRERRSWVEEGDVGTLSCSPVGPGGWTGCMIKQWVRDREQHAWK